MPTVVDFERMFPYLSVLSSFTKYLKTWQLWSLFLCTMALYLMFDYLPNMAVIFLSYWDEALLLRDVFAVQQLLPWVLGFYLVTTICGALARLCDRCLTTNMTNRFAKDAFLLATSQRYINFWLGDAQNSRAKTPLVSTIIRDPDKYFSNVPKLMASLISAVFFSALAIWRLYDFGLIRLLRQALVIGVFTVLFASFFTRRWNNHYLARVNASQKASDTLNELRYSQNVFSQPNTIPLYRKVIFSCLDTVQSAQHAISRLRFFSDVFSGVLDTCTQPLFMVGVFYSMYYYQAGTVTYATLRMLSRLLVSVYSALVAILKNRESLAEMQTSLFNMQGFAREYQQVTKKDLNKRSTKNSLSAKGRYSLSQKDKCFHINFRVYDPDSNLIFTYELPEPLRQSSRYALVGENGSGKSTFLHVLSGLVPFQSSQGSLPSVVYYASTHKNLALLLGTCPVGLGLILYYWPMKHKVRDLQALTHKSSLKVELTSSRYGRITLGAVMQDVLENLRFFALDTQWTETILRGTYMNFLSICSQGQMKALNAAIIFAVAKHAQPDLVILDEIAGEMDITWLKALDTLIDSYTASPKSKFSVIEVRHPNIKKRLGEMTGILCMHQGKMYNSESLSDFENFKKNNGMSWGSSVNVETLCFPNKR